MMIGLVVALFASTSAFATTPAQDVYNPDGNVLDFVATPTPTPTCAESGGGSGGSGNAGSENCGTTKPSSGVESSTECGSGTAGSGSSGSASEECGGTASNVCGSGAAGNDGNGSTGTAGSSACKTVKAGELPFTGYETGIVALLGVALLGGGVAMRRITRLS